MRWEGRRQSENVEDRRSVGQQVVVGGGLLTLLFMIVLMFLGVDPMKALQVAPEAAGPADITTTRSESAIASSRSWVTNITALRSRAQRSSSRLPMICRVCASSGPKGSSISRMAGSRISTCASATRLRWPPESMCG